MPANSTNTLAKNGDKTDLQMEKCLQNQPILQRKIVSAAKRLLARTRQSAKAVSNQHNQRQKCDVKNTKSVFYIAFL